MGAVVRDSTWDSVFPVDILPALSGDVSKAWPRVGPIRRGSLEDKITRKLIPKIRLETRRCDLPVTVHSQWEVLAPQGNIIGKIDIYVNAHQVEGVYFSFECKRLNVRYPSGSKSEAGKYCDDGMMRYVDGRYAPRLGRGGMIGYVMDGRCGAAIKAVNRAISGRQEALRLRRRTPLLQSSVMLDCPDARDSHHRTVADRDFTIHHLFLAVPES